MGKLSNLADLFKRVIDGDPVAIGLVVLFLVLAGLSGVILVFVRRKLRREDEEWARKRGRKLPKE